MDVHHPFAFAEQAGIAVGVAGAEGGGQGGGLGGEPPAIAGRLAGLQLLHHADHRFHGHGRPQAGAGDVAAGRVAVQDDARAAHAAGPGQAGGPVGVEQGAGRVVAVDQGGLPAGSPQGLEGADKQGVLGGGVGCAVRPCLVGR